MNPPIRLFAALVVSLALTGVARAQGALQLSNEAFQEITTPGPDGKPVVRHVPVTKVLPGTEVIYVVTYRNAGAEPAKNVVISNPLPSELSYLGGSASREGARFEVSVDGGKAYGALFSLQVTDAEGHPRPARASDVTHLRWILGRAVAPGEEGSFSYRVALK